MSKLSTTYMGLKLKNPLVAASSGLTGTVARIRDLEDAGIAAVVLKSLFEEQIMQDVSQADTDVYPEASDYLRTYVRQHSVEAHLALLRDAKKATSIPVIASVNCASGHEWTDFALEFERVGADALELNIFLLPTERTVASEVIEARYCDVVARVCGAVKIPVAVKIGFCFTNIAGFAARLAAAGARAVTLFNRFYEPDINLDTLEMTASEVFSAPSESRRNLRLIGMVSAAVPELEIAASTGIHDSAAVVKMLLAGARVAQLCSALYLHGPQTVGQILADMEQFMARWNFTCIDDFRARLSYRNITAPEMYERTQFMRYYAGRNEQ
ncbi:MAG: dihydroorotate dehydrogenase-like protein [Bacteroidales bacterium]|jgi:dihydroorotate dehydrogenase (fumarate)|nr:dihydroorotate dehydrogenase-like protein [Bacteroidales bacterium]